MGMKGKIAVLALGAVVWCTLPGQAEKKEGRPSRLTIGGYGEAVASYNFF